MRWFLLCLLAACAAAPAPVAPAAKLPGLDELFRASWAGIEPAPAADDAEWFRRVHLDLIGRVPSLAETRAFLAGPGRVALVDRLLASREHAEHWADLTSDRLVGRQARLRPKRGDLRPYLVDAIGENRGWDRVTRELLTASGSPDDDGAVAFLAINAGKGAGAAHAAGVTARVFLGQSIECAECHDHPYDESIKQADFAGFAAFFADVKARRGELVERPRRREPRFASVAPRFHGRDLAIPRGTSRRAVLADALVATPEFARAAVDQVFATLFGAAPGDAIGERLAADFRASGFDRRALVRRLVLSTAYARSSRAPGDPAPAEQAFARARVRPLGADALFRSLLVATGLDRPAKRQARALREVLFVFPDDEMAERDAFTGSVAQALLLQNGELVGAGVRARVLGEALAGPDPLATLFLAAYARPPTPDERALFAPRSRPDWEDVFFALLTSSEFLTNH